MPSTILMVLLNSWTFSWIIWAKVFACPFELWGLGTTCRKTLQTSWHFSSYFAFLWINSYFLKLFLINMILHQLLEVHYFGHIFPSYFQVNTYFSFMFILLLRPKPLFTFKFLQRTSLWHMLSYNFITSQFILLFHFRKFWHENKTKTISKVEVL